MERDGMRMKAVLLLAAIVAIIVASAATPGAGGFEPSAFPIPQERPPVQPATYAFAIWGLIFVALAAHGITGLVSRAEEPDWDAPRWPLMASLVVGAPWLAVAKFAPLIATVQILVMMVFAVVALLRSPRGGEAWVRVWPVALYAGWLTAAAWVAVGFSLAGYGVTGERTAAILALVGAVATALAVQRRVPHAPLYGAAAVWAVVAVVVANAGSNLAVAVLAAIGAGAVGFSALRAMRDQATRVAS